MRVNELLLWPMIYAGLVEAYTKDRVLQNTGHKSADEFGELDYERIGGGAATTATSDRSLDKQYWKNHGFAGPDFNNLFCWAHAPGFYLDYVNGYWRNKDANYSLLNVGAFCVAQVPLFSEDA